MSSSSGWGSVTPVSSRGGERMSSRYSQPRSGPEGSAGPSPRSPMPTDHDPVALVALRDEPLSVDEVLDTVRHPTCGGIALFVGRRARPRPRRRRSPRSTTRRTPAPSTPCARTCEDVLGRSDAVRVAAVHRTGALQVGDLAVVVAAAAPHRGQAFDACRDIIDTLKARRPRSGSTRAWATVPPSGWGCREPADHDVLGGPATSTRQLPPAAPARRGAPGPARAAAGGAPHRHLRRHRARGGADLRRPAVRRHVARPGHQHPGQGRRQAAAVDRGRPDLPHERQPSTSRR